MRDRIVWAVAFLTLLVALSGALAGTNSTLPTPSAGRLLSATAHRHAAMGLGAIAVLALAWFATTEKRRDAARLAWMLLIGFLSQGAAGFASPLVHAILAHALVAGACGLALIASRAWTSDPQYVRDYGWPSMRSLAIAVPLLTLLQAALGAAFRRQFLGVMPHVIGAMVVSMLILMLGAFVLNQFPAHPRLRPAARLMLGIMFVQVFLGIAAYTVRSIPDPGAAVSLSIIGGHVITGALTVAATLALGMSIRREVQPKA